MVLGLGLVIYDLVSKKDVTVVSEYVDTTDTTDTTDSSDSDE